MVLMGMSLSEVGLLQGHVGLGHLRASRRFACGRQAVWVLLLHYLLVIGFLVLVAIQNLLRVGQDLVGVRIDRNIDIVESDVGALASLFWLSLLGCPALSRWVYSPGLLSVLQLLLLLDYLIDLVFDGLHGVWIVETAVHAVEGRPL